ALHGRTLVAASRTDDGTFGRDGQESPECRPGAATEADVMRCDQFLPALTTGTAIGRWRAPRHAARCPRCARAQAEIRRLEGELAAASALTAAERALWTSVAEDHPVPVIPLRWGLNARLAAAAAIAAMLAFLLWPRAGGPVVRPHPVVAPIVADRELDG